MAPAPPYYSAITGLLLLSDSLEGSRIGLHVEDATRIGVALDVTASGPDELRAAFDRADASGTLRGVLRHEEHLLSPPEIGDGQPVAERPPHCLIRGGRNLAEQVGGGSGSQMTTLGLRCVRPRHAPNVTSAPRLNPEQSARVRIDEMLEEAGWIVQDFLYADPEAGPGVAVRELWTPPGPMDYALFVGGKVAGSIEAKGEGHTLRGVETQADRAAPRHPAGSGDAMAACRSSGQDAAEGIVPY